jgi:hypothetical protein
MKVYRVTYPLIATDGYRNFDTREAAEAFASKKRNNPGRHAAIACAADDRRMVRVEEVESDTDRWLVLNLTTGEVLDRW